MISGPSARFERTMGSSNAAETARNTSRVMGGSWNAATCGVTDCGAL